MEKIVRKDLQEILPWPIIKQSSIDENTMKERDWLEADPKYNTEKSGSKPKLIKELPNIE